MAASVPPRPVADAAASAAAGDAEALNKTAERPASPWGDAEDERAAIIEHDGGAPREWAEGFARLDPDRPPGDVLPQRWLQFVNDVGRFLDGGFAMQAAALGWGPFELFGCDRDWPFGRIDNVGLIWQLNGDRLVALTADAAIIETRNGARQALRRKLAEPGHVLTWELLS
jgi:hypothetical protein